MTFFEKMMNIDRRIIFLLIAIVVIVPFFIEARMPIKVTKPVLDVYRYIDGLPEGSAVMISASFEPAAEPELVPMMKSVIRHCMKKKIKVIGMTLLMQGVGLLEDALTTVAREFDAKDGEDYVNLGFTYGGFLVILGMGEDICEVYEYDVRGNATRDMPIFKDVRNYNDIALVVDFSSGGTPMMWITYAYTRFNQKIAAGVTSVMAMDFYPFLQTGQLIGLINGLKGAAEYESLIEKPERAVLGMNPQSAAHMLIVILIIIGNIGYFMKMRKKSVP